MSVTLHVDREPWMHHLASTWTAYGQLVPVVKGNGYGFGLERLARLAVDLGAEEVAVGTVQERRALPAGPRAVVLTPALAHELEALPEPELTVLTVGSLHHVAELHDAGVRGRVVVKLATPMRRYGVMPSDLPPVLEALDRAGQGVHAFGLHFPLASSSADHARGIERWLPSLPADAVLHVSHVDPPHLDEVRAAHPRLQLMARVGTALWHGDKSWFGLRTDVLDRHPVRAGEHAGYRLVEVPGDGEVVLCSGGTAHGVHPLADGRSPFHFGRRRLTLLEPPHQHTSMLFVPHGAPCPEVGDEVDLQRPLTETRVDRIVEH